MHEHNAVTLVWGSLRLAPTSCCYSHPKLYLHVRGSAGHTPTIKSPMTYYTEADAETLWHHSFFKTLVTHTQLCTFMYLANQSTWTRVGLNYPDTSCYGLLWNHAQPCLKRFTSSYQTSIFHKRPPNQRRQRCLPHFVRQEEKKKEHCIPWPQP